jgi:hypothetical protein
MALNNFTAAVLITKVDALQYCLFSAAGFHRRLLNVTTACSENPAVTKW